jgi:hypothetical protein
MYTLVTHIFGIVAVSMYWAGNTHKEHLPSVMALVPLFVGFEVRDVRW